MLRSIIAISVFTASVLACPQHGNYHYPGAQIKKRADAGHERDWDYAASNDWGVAAQFRCRPQFQKLPVLTMAYRERFWQHAYGHDVSLT